MDSQKKTILHPSMNTEEKVRIANELFKPLMRKAEFKLDARIRKITKTCRFPFFFTQEIETSEHGKWIVILTIPEKPTFKKGYRIMFDAFQPYIIDYARNPENNGLGFFMITACDTCVRMDEWTPHLINRMMQRGDALNTDMTVKSICLYMRKLIHDTLMSVKQVTHNARGEEMFEFVQSIPGGQFLGLITKDSSYRCCKTYISEHEMKDSQYVHNEILRQITLHKDKHPGTFDVDMEYINPKLQQKYGETTFEDIAVLLNGTDKSVWNSENIKKIAMTL